MRSLAFAAVAVTLGITFACSGGPGTIGTGTGVGADPAPSTGDKAKSSSQQPPSSTDPTGKPGACFACVDYVCGTGKDTFPIEFSSKQDGCYSGKVKIDTCNKMTLNDQNVTITLQPTSGGVRVCVSENSQTVCVDCVPGTIKQPTPGFDGG